MRWQKAFRLAWNILVHARLRSYLTILGIVIGVAAIVAIVSIGAGAQTNIQQRLGGLGADQVTVSAGASRASFFGGGRDFGTTTTAATSKNLTDQDVRIVSTVDGVLFVDPTVSGRATVTYLAQSAQLSVDGVDPLAWQNMVSTSLASGRYLNPGDTNVVVLGSSVADSVFKQPIAVNRMISIEGHAFKVVGVLQSAGGRDDSTIYMPVKTAQQTLTGVGKDSYDSLIVKVRDASLATQVANDITTRLQISRHETNRTRDFTVSTPQAIQQRVSSVTDTFTIFLAAIAAVSLLVGAVGITNTMFTSVLEKTKEIGILKAIGARNRDILSIFLLNAGLVGLVGGVIGVLFGALISYALPNLIGLRIGPGGHLTTVLPPSLLIGSLLLSVALGMMAGVVPAYRASRLKPVDALRYE